jgi:hypothetical protein
MAAENQAVEMEKRGPRRETPEAEATDIDSI